MGEITKIAWTDATFNPWWGCTQISPGCDHCYAKTLDERLYKGRHWEDMRQPESRKLFTPKHWNEVYKWNEKARQSEQPMKVFCGSMCDVFEDVPYLEETRLKLWKLMLDTPDLTWLVLTKRPFNINRFAPLEWITNAFPANIWLGVTVENQHYLHRVAELDGYQASVFVSVEPMLGPVSFKDWYHLIDWVIIGGESGPNARKMELKWVNDLVAEAELNRTKVFFKQFGGWPDKGDDIEKHPALGAFPREFPDF